MNTPIQGGDGDKKPDNQPKHERGEKIRKGIGESLILLVYLFFDFRDQWPKSHALALIAGVVGISAVALIELTWKRWTTLTVTTMAVALVAYFAFPPELPEETEHHGWLIPADDPFPNNNTCTPKDTKKDLGWVYVLLAKGGVLTHTGKLTAVEIGGKPVIRMARGEKGLSVDVDMVDAKGNLVVRIEKNEWRATPSEVAYVLRPDRSTLVVYDLSGRELLWLRYMNETLVKIRGLFFKQGNETPIVITDSDISVPTNISMYVPMVTKDPTRWFACFIIETDTFDGPIISFN